MHSKIFILILISQFGFAQNTYVPDDNFEQALIDLGYDDTLDDYVLTANISGVTNLHVGSKEISDLTGIEDFIALTNLQCQGNQLTSLDVSNNTALTSLECWNNQLTSLDVSANTALTWLNCAINQLTSLDVSTNTALTGLSCYSNQLTTLDVSNNTALTGLWCGANDLTSLDVSSNTALNELHCNHNQLTSLDVSANTDLTELHCFNNQLTSLDVSKNTALDELQVQDNQLTTLDLSNNTALATLHIEHNQLTYLNMKNGVTDELEYFTARNNSLTCIETSDPDYATANWTNIDSGVTFGVFCSSVDRTKWHVATTGSDGSGSGTEASPLASIQTAINASTDGDTVSVAAGTYVENINFRGRNIKVVGEDRETTIIDGNQNGPVVDCYFNDNMYFTPVLQSVTLTNGVGINFESNILGGGIFARYSNPQLNDVMITNCSANLGSAIYTYNPATSDITTIKNCVITGNTAGANDGTIHATTSNIKIVSSLISDNSSGGGLFFDGIDVSSQVINSSIINNANNMGVMLQGGTNTIINSIISGNESTQLRILSSCNLTVEYSDIDGGQDSVLVEGNAVLNWGSGNIDKNPSFVDAANGDYSLLNYSPAIGAGASSVTISDVTYNAPSTDMVGNPRPNPAGSAPDMGAYESELGTPLPKTIYTVRKDGTGDYTTIQAAIDVVSDGDTVSVAAGTYIENINFNGKNIAVIGENQKTTIIDGNESGSVVTFENSEDSTTVLKGFTITNGYAQNTGGGITINGASPIVESCIISENISYESGVSGGYGGGIKIEGISHLKIRNTTISNNLAHMAGGGIHSGYESNVILENVLIYENKINSYGGNAIYGHGGTFSMVNVTIVNNKYDTSNTMISNSLGISFSDSYVSIINSIIRNNGESEIIFNTGGAMGTDDSLKIMYSNILGNLQSLGSFVVWNNNIDSDPLFVDAANGNYHLSNFSPAIGAGIASIVIDGVTYNAPSTDIDGNSRPNPSGSAPDMGAYESKYSSRNPKANTISDGLSDTLEIDFSNATTSLSAHWKKFDNDGTVTYEYAIGTTGYNDFVDWTSTGTDTFVTATGLTLTSGATYYFSVRGTATSGQVSDTSRTDGVFIDNEKPVISSVSESPGVFRNTSFKWSSGQGANFIDPFNLNNDFTVQLWVKYIGPEEYDHSLSIVLMRPWTLTMAISRTRMEFNWENKNDGLARAAPIKYNFGTDHSHLNSSGNLAKDKWYHITLQKSTQNHSAKTYLNGTEITSYDWAGQNEHQDLIGLITTETNFLGVESPVYEEAPGEPIWILDELRVWNYPLTSEEIQSNLYGELQGTPSSLIGYWKFNEGLGDTLFNSAGSSNNVNINDNGTTPLGSWYDLDTWQTDFSNSLVNVDWYGPGKSAKIITMATDNDTISKYEYSIGTSAGNDDVVSWFKGDSNVVSIDLTSFTENIQYYSNARVTDAVGSVSDVVSSDGFQMDLTAPVTGMVSNGESFQTDTTLVTLTWSGFSDTPSGLSHYEYSLGTQPGAGNVVARTNVGLAESIALSSLDLDNNQTYYGTVYALDLVGNEAFASSDGVTIDRTGPTIGTIADGSGEDIEWANVNTSASANWSGFEDVNGIAKYEVSLGSVAKGSDIVGWVDIGTDTSHTFNDLSLSNNTQYFFNVKATDGIGNESEIASSNGFTIDITAPSIISVTGPTSNTLAIFDNVSIEMTLSEQVLSENVSFVSSTGDNVGFTYNIADQTILNISLTAPFTSGDSYTINVNGLTDRANNITNGLEYNYVVALLADYDADGSIGIIDLNTFVSGWEGKDTQFEIGPVIGTAPNFKPALDGVYNARDGMAFVRMWHWDNDQAGKLIAKMLDKAGENLMVSFDNENLVFNPPVGTQAAEIIINYPQAEIQILPKNQNVTDNMAMALTKVDTISGKLLSHQMIIENQAISFELQHYQKKDVTITISYQYISKDNEIIGSGNTDLILKPVPQEFALHQNYPNPFNPVTTINYDLPQQTHVNLMIYDILGREVVKLISEEIPAGYQSVIWNTRNSFGTPVSAGIYFYQIQTKGFVKTKKMVLLK